MRTLSILWNFSRPHTLIGSIISICTLYLIICGNQITPYLPYLIMALIIGITCNIFIVGINQIADVNIDKINKPYLPIASGKLKIREAKFIVGSAICISLTTAVYISPYLFFIIASAATIGWIYSMPPFYLKQHHIGAAIAISVVRGILLNAGGFMVFNYMINNSLKMPENVLLLTLFIIVFSIVIAWFKDLPDMKGDAKYNIKTFALLYSPKTTLIIGNILIGLAYLFTIYIKFKDLVFSEFPTVEMKVLLYGHIALLLLFAINSLTVNLSDHQSIKKFYQRIWWFFFAEYLLYLVAYLPW